MIETELFPPATGGINLRAYRNDLGRWHWIVDLRLDTALERRWHFYQGDSAENRDEAMMALLEVLTDVLSAAHEADEAAL